MLEYGVDRRRVLVTLLLVAAAAGAAAQEREPDLIRWPSPEYPTLQRAVDALAEGGTLRIAAGVYRLTQPLMIGKRVVLEGAGCSFRPPRAARELMEGGGFSSPRLLGRGTFTRLIGPEPREPGRFAEVVGAVNFAGPRAAGTLKGIELRGFDAGIVVSGRESEEPRPDGGRGAAPAPVSIVESCALGSGRGLVVRDAGTVNVISSSFVGSLWTGIAVSSPLKSLLPSAALNLKQTFVQDAQNHCIYFENQIASVTQSVIQGCGANGTGVGIAALDSQVLVDKTTVAPGLGPGIALVDSAATLTQTTVTGTRRYGIAAFNPGPVHIEDSLVHDSNQDPVTGQFGDGVIVAASQPNTALTLHDTVVASSDRAGLSNFGSHVELLDALIIGAAFHLDGEVLGSLNHTWTDVEGNLCGDLPVEPSLQELGQLVSLLNSLPYALITNPQLSPQLVQVLGVQTYLLLVQVSTSLTRCQVVTSSLDPGAPVNSGSQ